jgi:hypothetical protein
MDLNTQEKCEGNAELDSSGCVTLGGDQETPDKYQNKKILTLD